MNDLSIKMNAYLAAAWPAISTINWPDYNIYPGDYSPKYTGILTHFIDGESVYGANTQAYGFLPCPERSAMMVTNKVTSLLKNGHAKTSMGLRNPDYNVYGGGVRSSVSANIIFALSGLPEFADHVIVVALMQKCGMLTFPDAQNLLLLKNNQMNVVLGNIGLLPTQYDAFVGHIFSIIK